MAVKPVRYSQSTRSLAGPCATAFCPSTSASPVRATRPSLVLAQATRKRATTAEPANKNVCFSLTAEKLSIGGVFQALLLHFVEILKNNFAGPRAHETKG